MPATQIAYTYGEALAAARARFLANRTAGNLRAVYGAASDYIENVGPLDDATATELEGYQKMVSGGLTLGGITVPWVGVVAIGALVAFVIFGSRRRR